MLHDKQHIILSVHSYIQEIIRIEEMEESYDNCFMCMTRFKTETT